MPFGLELYLIISAVLLPAWVVLASNTAVPLAFLGIAGGVLFLSDRFQGIGGILLFLTLLLVALRLITLIFRTMLSELLAARLSIMRLLLGSAWRSSPIFILMASAIWLSSEYSREQLIPIYALDGGSISCGTGTKLLCGPPMPLDDDLKALVARANSLALSAAFLRLNLAFSKLDQQGESSAQEFLDAIFDGPVPAFPADLTQVSDAFQLPPACGVFQWVTHVSDCLHRNAMLPLHIAYTEARGALRTELKDLAVSVPAGSDQVVINRMKVRAYNFLAVDVPGLKRQADNSINRVATIFQLLNAVWLIALVNAVGRGYFYIFARLACDTGCGCVAMRFSSNTSEDRKPIFAQTVTQSENGYGFKIPLSSSTWFISELPGVRLARKGIPALVRPFDLFWSRLFRFRITMQRFSVADGYDSLTGRAGHETCFIHVKLDSGQRLAFELNNLLAFTDGIRLRRRWSFRLAAFIHRRFRYSCAEGEGELLLRTVGGAATLHPDPNIFGSDPADFVAFDFDGRFSETCRNDIWSVYVHGVSVVPEGKTMAVEQSYKPPVTSGLNTLRKVAFFLLPF